MKTRVLPMVMLFFTGVLSAQIPNSGFEVWENYVDGSTTFEKPDMWVGSLAYTNGAGFSIDKNQESYPAGTGQFSIKIQANMSIGVRGVALSSDWPDPMTNWIPKPTFALGYKPATLNLYYKYLPDSGDTMLVMIYFYKDGNLLGTPQSYGTNNLVANWTALEIPLTFGLTTPDSAAILLMSGIYAQHNGSTLYVDNLNFNGFIGEQEFAVSKFAIYPNPANHVLWLDSEEDGMLWLYNLSGSLVLKQNIGKGTTAIDVQYLPIGMYVAKIVSGNTSSYHRILIVR